MPYLLMVRKHWNSGKVHLLFNAMPKTIRILKNIAVDNFQKGFIIKMVGSQYTLKIQIIILKNCVRSVFVMIIMEYHLSFFHDAVLNTRVKYIVGSKPTDWLHFVVDTLMSRNGKAVYLITCESLLNRLRGEELGE